MRKSAASSADRMWFSSLDTSRGLQAPRCLKGGQALFKNLLVNHCIPPSGSRFEGDGGEGRGARSRSLDLTLAW